MITIEEALELVEHNLPEATTKHIPLADALDLILAEDVISPISMPPFRQSAMDGYAVAYKEGASYEIIGEVKAGDDHNPELKQGQGVRIFTGAAVPDSADTVIIQEHVTSDGQHITVHQTVSKNQNIRPKGEQNKQGAMALEKGNKLSPAAIGYLAGLGITQVTVFPKPTVAIITTGNELVSPGEPLPYGKIYESNGIMLSNALLKNDYQDVDIFKVKDDYQSTLNLFKDVINQFDVILISGGISVGDYDFVGKALKELDVQEIFYKVKQKPGKPLFFGKKDNKTIFALPGNPASTLSCFYIYVIPALAKLSGNSFEGLPRVKAKSLSNYEVKGDRSQFLKAFVSEGRVEILEGQSSAMLHTFAMANALVYVTPEESPIEIGTTVEVVCLPI